MVVPHDPGSFVIFVMLCDSEATETMGSCIRPRTHILHHKQYADYITI